MDPSHSSLQTLDLKYRKFSFGSSLAFLCFIQECVLHDLVLFATPSHSDPQYEGGGLLHDLDLVKESFE